MPARWAVAALRARELRLGTVEDQTSVMRVWTRRYHDLGRLRTQLLCRLHAVLCEVVPGGFRKELPAGQAIAILDSIVAQSPVTQTKLELARDLVVDLQRLDAQRRDARRRTGGRSPPRARRSPTSTVSGPITAGAVLGYVRDVHRFANRDHFASYNGTAPIEVSSGDRKVYRLSRRRNRQLNHAIHMAAVSQIRYHGTQGRAYYQKKIAEGMTGKSALRSLKRKISDALYADDRRRSTPSRPGPPGGHSGKRCCIQRGRLTPQNTGSSDKPLPGHPQP
jgi:transposase